MDCAGSQSLRFSFKVLFLNFNSAIAANPFEGRPCGGKTLRRGVGPEFSGAR